MEFMYTRLYLYLYMHIIQLSVQHKYETCISAHVIALGRSIRKLLFFSRREKRPSKAIKPNGIFIKWLFAILLKFRIRNLGYERLWVSFQIRRCLWFCATKPRSSTLLHTKLPGFAIGVMAACSFCSRQQTSLVIQRTDASVLHVWYRDAMVTCERIGL